MSIREHRRVRLAVALLEAREAGEGAAGAGFLTATELAKLAGYRRVDVLGELEASPEFVSVTGLEARALGRSARAVLWALATWPVDAESLALAGVSDATRSAIREAREAGER